MRQGVLAIATAAAVFLAAGGAYATGSSHHNDDIHIQNTNHNDNKNYNKNYNKNDNINKNTNVNQNENYNKNYNTNNNTNKNYNDSNAEASSNANAQSTSNATAGATGGNAVSEGGNANSSTSISIQGDENPVSSAAPVYLTSSNDTCMGSTGIGGQGMTFGFSIGTTWTDKNCIMLKNSRAMKNQGHDNAAKARLCMNEDNAIAFELAGTPCPRKLKSAQDATAKINFWKESANASVAVQIDGQTARLKTEAADGDTTE